LRSSHTRQGLADLGSQDEQEVGKSEQRFPHFSFRKTQLRSPKRHKILMKLYHLSFHSGEYDDYREDCLGTYSSEEERDRAIERYRAAYKRDGIMFFFEEGGYREGKFEKWESVLDKDNYPGVQL